MGEALVLVRVEEAEEGRVLGEVDLDLRHARARPVLEPRLAEVVFDVMKTAFAHVRMIGIASDDRHRPNGSTFGAAGPITLRAGGRLPAREPACRKRASGPA